MDKIICEFCGSESLYKKVRGKFVGIIYANGSGGIEDLEITDDEGISGYICEDCNKEN